MKKLFKLLPALSMAATIALSAASALANTAANTQIINKAQLNFSGGSAQSTSIVTVALIPSTPNVTITRGDAIYTGVNTPTMPNTVTIIATANGPADYTVAPSVTASTNTKGLPDVQPDVTGGTTIKIGASVTTGVSGATWITVPASGASGASPAEINGIAIGDTIVFTAGGTQYTPTVTGFTDNGLLPNGDHTYKINYTGATNIAPAGTQVGELKLVTLTASPGTINTLGTDLTTTVKAVVSTDAAPFGGAPAPLDAEATTAPANKWTTTNPNIVFFKYSRNVYNAAGNTNGVTSITYSINSNTNTYYRDGVTGKPGDTIEYIIQATNNGATDISGCVISDQLPVASVSNPIVVTDYGSTQIYYSDTTNTVNNQTLAPGSLASYSSPNLSINVGVGATGALSGTIPSTKGVTVGYQVTIK